MMQGLRGSGEAQFGWSVGKSFVEHRVSFSFAGTTH